MSEKYYKIGSVWMRWSYAHNQLGYTTNPTVAVDYISTDPLTWGEEISGSHGYYDGDVYEPQDGLYFTNDVSPEYRGWKTADILARLGRMPSECIIDDAVKFTDGSVQSKCALLKIDEQYEHEDYYLIASAVNLGWHTISEWEALGWSVYVPDFLFGGDFSGNDIPADTVGGGGGNVSKYSSYKSLSELRGWEPGGNIEKYYQLEINLGIRWDVAGGSNSWLAKTFPANDWWWSGILSNNDVTALQAIGAAYCPTTNTSEAWPGLVGALKFEREKFKYYLIDMFSDIGTTPVTFSDSNFWLGGYYDPDSDSLAYKNCMLIHSISKFNTATMTYRVKITSKSSHDKLAYLKDDQTDFVSGISNFSRYIYDKNGNTIPYNSAKTYTVTGGFKSTDKPIRYTSATISEDNGALYLTVTGFNTSDREFCYIEYTET